MDRLLKRCEECKSLSEGSFYRDKHLRNSSTFQSSILRLGSELFQVLRWHWCGYIELQPCNIWSWNISKCNSKWSLQGWKGHNIYIFVKQYYTQKRHIKWHQEMMNSYIWSSDAELWKHLFIWSMERLSKSSYWIPFFRHSKNSCWKTERVQGKKGCWSGTQGKVPQQWAREVEKRCWEREKEENWWPVWEGSEMEAQAVERVQRTTEEEVFQIHFYPEPSLMVLLQPWRGWHTD